VNIKTGRLPDKVGYATKGSFEICRHHDGTMIIITKVKVHGEELGDGEPLVINIPLDMCYYTLTTLNSMFGFCCPVQTTAQQDMLSTWGVANLTAMSNPQLCMFSPRRQNPHFHRGDNFNSNFIAAKSSELKATKDSEPKSRNDSGKKDDKNATFVSFPSVCDSSDSKSKTSGAALK
jgi:hypothetical protein